MKYSAVSHEEQRGVEGELVMAERGLQVGRLRKSTTAVFSPRRDRWLHHFCVPKYARGSLRLIKPFRRIEDIRPMCRLVTSRRERGCLLFDGEVGYGFVSYPTVHA